MLLFAEQPWKFGVLSFRSASKCLSLSAILEVVLADAQWLVLNISLECIIIMHSIMQNSVTLCILRSVLSEWHSELVLSCFTEKCRWPGCIWQSCKTSRHHRNRLLWAHFQGQVRKEGKSNTGDKPIIHLYYQSHTWEQKQNSKHTWNLYFVASSL